MGGESFLRRLSAPTGPIATARAPSVTPASSSTTPGARPTTTRGRGSPSTGRSAPATSSSGTSPTPATRRRCSATRGSGPSPAGDGRPGAELFLPAHGLPIAGRSGSPVLADGRRRLDSLVAAGRSSDERGRRWTTIVHEVAVPPTRSPPVPAAALRRARVRGAQHLASLRRLVGRKSGPAQAAVGPARSRPRSRPSPGGRPRSPPGPPSSPLAGDLRVACQLAEWAGRRRSGGPGGRTACGPTSMRPPSRSPRSWPRASSPPPPGSPGPAVR